MTTREVDVAIIGAGTAGLTARRAALANGAREIVMIEGGPYGTTCARVGCMPSKLLIAAAEAKHHADTAEAFGIRIDSRPRADGQAVMKRVQSERDRFTGFVERAVDDFPAEQKIRGWASFTGPNELQVALEAGGEMTVKAKAIVVATGTEPFVPPAFRGLEDRILTNETVFELETLPESMAVIGAGVIGLELGQAFHRLGVRVTFLSRSDRVGPVQDPDLQEVARGIFSEELDIHLNARWVEAQRKGEQVELTWTGADGKSHNGRFEYVLAATGRRPNLERLRLDRAGIELDEHGMPRFDHADMQVGDSPIFVAGDFVGERTLLHEAADEGRIAGENAARYPRVVRQARRTPLGIMFTDPNMAGVGLSYSELDPKRHAYGEVDYSDQGRARVMLQNKGRVRIWGEIETGRLVAAYMIGPRVEHTAHLLAWSIQQGMTVDEALDMPFYHPVIEEGIRTALRGLAHAIKHADRSEADFSPGD